MLNFECFYFILNCPFLSFLWQCSEFTVQYYCGLTVLSTVCAYRIPGVFVPFGHIKIDRDNVFLQAKRSQVAQLTVSKHTDGQSRSAAKLLSPYSY